MKKITQVDNINCMHVKIDEMSSSFCELDILFTPAMPCDEHADDSETLWLLELIQYNRQVHCMNFRKVVTLVYKSDPWIQIQFLYTFE